MMFPHDPDLDRVHVYARGDLTIADGEVEAGEEGDKMTFIIRSAGAREAMLNNAGERVGQHTYATLEAAVAALRLGDDAVTAESCEGGAWYVYRDQESADRDETGAAAEALIVQVAD